MVVRRRRGFIDAARTGSARAASGSPQSPAEPIGRLDLSSDLTTCRVDTYALADVAHTSGLGPLTFQAHSKMKRHETLKQVPG